MNEHERIAAKFRVESLEAEPSKLTSTKISKKEILKICIVTGLVMMRSDVMAPAG